LLAAVEEEDDDVDDRKNSWVRSSSLSLDGNFF